MAALCPHGEVSRGPLTGTERQLVVRLQSYPISMMISYLISSPLLYSLHVMSHVTLCLHSLFVLDLMLQSLRHSALDLFILQHFSRTSTLSVNGSEEE